jgi:hypothetical protein
MKPLSLLLGAGALLLVSCAGDDDLTRDGSAFLAFASDFEHYRSWRSFDLPAAAVPSSPHTDGPRTEYLNREPPKGSTAFPIGTIIVKDIQPTDDQPARTFAMVKRGGTYNANGAVGWEWFELKTVGTSSVGIAWRGFGPPRGETYGGDAFAGCNTCHMGARDNDYVLSPAIRLRAQ